MKVFLNPDKKFDLAYWSVTENKLYDVEIATQYDCITYEPFESFIVRCDDGKMRKMDPDWFIKLHELRDRKLNELKL